MSKHLSRKIFMSLAALGFALQLTACTSSDEKSDGEDVQQDAIESLDEGDTAAAAPASGGDDAMLSDALPEDALGVDDQAAAEAPPATDSMDNELDAADNMGASASAEEPPPLVTDPGADAMAMQPPPSEMPASEPMPEPAAPEAPSSSMASNEYSPPAEEQPKRASIPLQKSATKPWKVGNDWFNGVYYARPGDSLKSISRAIYGKNRSALLKKGNPTYAGREPRPGDKVYYSSPKRPDDSERMMSWFEDNGMQPQIYVAKSGDNIRGVSKTLLGYEGAWKETWSSNPMIESKGELSEGTEIHYWASLPAPAASAETQVAKGDQGPSTPAPVDQAAALPPPPPMDAMPSDMPPPPDMAMNNQFPDAPPAPGMNDLPPPPMPETPPPPQAMNDIPPPPPLDHSASSASVKGTRGEEEPTAADQDTMMALGAIAIAAGGIAALLVVRRRRRQKDLEMHIDSTQVG